MWIVRQGNAYIRQDNAVMYLSVYPINTWTSFCILICKRHWQCLSQPQKCLAFFLCWMIYYLWWPDAKEINIIMPMVWQWKNKRSHNNKSNVLLHWRWSVAVYCWNELQRNPWSLLHSHLVWAAACVIEIKTDNREIAQLLLLHNLIGGTGHQSAATHVHYLALLAV